MKQIRILIAINLLIVFLFSALSVSAEGTLEVSDETLITVLNGTVGSRLCAKITNTGDEEVSIANIRAGFFNDSGEMISPWAYGALYADNLQPGVYTYTQIESKQEGTEETASSYEIEINKARDIIYTTNRLPCKVNIVKTAACQDPAMLFGGEEGGITESKNAGNGVGIKPMDSNESSSEGKSAEKENENSYTKSENQSTPLSAGFASGESHSESGNESYPDGNICYVTAEVTNNTDKVLYEIEVVFALLDDEDHVLLVEQHMAEGVGVMPGSTIEMRCYLYESDSMELADMGYKPTKADAIAYWTGYESTVTESEDDE